MCITYSGTCFTMHFQVQHVPLPATTELSWHAHLQLTGSILTLPLLSRCTSKPKTNMVTHMSGFIFTQCLLLEWALCRITGNIQCEKTENVVPAISQGWKLKPLFAASFFTTLVTKFPGVKYRLYITAPSSSCSSLNCWLDLKDE